MPKTTMNDRIAARAARWNSSSAIAGKMLRSSPTMAPTKAFTTTSSENCARLARSPRRTGGGTPCLPPPPGPARVRPPPPRPHRQAGGTPLGEPLHQPPSPSPAPAEDPQRLEGHQAIRAPAVRNDLFPGRQLPQATRQVLQRDRNRARDVPRPILLGRPGVHHHDRSRAHPPPQLLTAGRPPLVPG